MGEGKLLAFGDLGVIFDGPHATPSRIADGPYFLNIASLKEGRLDLDESDHVSDSDFTVWTRRVTPEHDDLLFSYETRLGEAALMPPGVAACLGRRMALLRPNRNVVDPRFLLYFYLGPQMRLLIDTHTIQGATVNRIPLKSMATWPIRIPEMHEQRGIADVLGALDDKIAANARLVATADELAALMYDRIANEDDAVARPLSDLAEFVNGKAFTKGASGNGRVVIRIAELNSGIGGSTVYNNIDVADHHLVRPGDLLFAWSGSLTVHRWYRPEAIVNQHIFKVIPRDIPTWVVRGALGRKLVEFKAIAADKATTMGHIQRHHLDEAVLTPSRKRVQENDKVMMGLWNRALVAECESLQLAETRDTLLPLLMSGQVRVKDAEVVVDRVGL